MIENELIPEQEQALSQQIPCIYENPLYAKTDIDAVLASIRKPSEPMSSIDWYGPMEDGAQVNALLAEILKKISSILRFSLRYVTKI